MKDSYTPNPRVDSTGSYLGNLPCFIHRRSRRFVEVRVYNVRGCAAVIRGSGVARNPLLSSSSVAVVLLLLTDRDSHSRTAFEPYPSSTASYRPPVPGFDRRACFGGRCLGVASVAKGVHHKPAVSANVAPPTAKGVPRKCVHSKVRRDTCCCAGGGGSARCGCWCALGDAPLRLARAPPGGGGRTRAL